MSDTAKPARPRQLTMAAGFVIGGSVILVLTIFDALASLDSVDRRERLSQMLSSPPLDGLDLTLADSLAWLRVGLPFTAVCASATAVLGVFVLQRHQGARVALTVLAVPLLLSTFLTLTGGFLGVLVAAATMMLWSGPARDWYAGRPIRNLEPPSRRSHPGPWEETMPSPEDRNRGHQPPEPPADQPVPPADTSPTDDSATPGSTESKTGESKTPPASSLSTSGSSTAPVPTTGFGNRPTQLAEPQVTAWLPPTYDEVTHATVVPTTVKIACVLTWGFSGLVALLYLGMLVALVIAQDRMVDLVLDSPGLKPANLDQDVLLPVLWVGCLMFLGWSLGAVLFAWFAWRRHNWARWLLAVSAAATLLAGFLAFPFGMLHQVAAVLTIAGLFSAAARAWYARVPWPPGPPPGAPPLPPPGQSGWQDGPPPPGGKPPVW